MIVDQFEEMIVQCESQPLVYPVAVHPMTVGQPFRLKLLREAFAHIAHHRRRDLVWFAPPWRIADHVMSLPPGVVPGSLP